MDFLPSLPVFAAFTLAALMLVITPGPDMTLFLSQTLIGGRSRGAMAVLGASTGLVVHSLLAAFGLSALLAASETAFLIVKVVGALYLVWLAVQALRHGAALSSLPDDGAPRPLHEVYLMGVGINLLNPKVVMFFVTFLPQFVEAGDPHAGAKMLVLGLYFIVIGAPACLAMVWGAESIAGFLRRSKAAMRAFDYSFAGIMSAFALKLLLTQR